MKKLMCALMALACLLGVTGCGGASGTEGATPMKPSVVWDILDAGACSEELEELDMDTAWMLFKLADYGLERDSLTDGAYFRSAGGTCEEVALLVFDSHESGQKAMEALADYVAAQIEANRDYRPADIPKLENAWQFQAGNTVLLAVVNDLEAAQNAEATHIAAG